MKKSLVALTLLAGMTAMNANATLIDFDDSSFGGTGITFDEIDWNVDLGNVTQTDTGDGQVFTGQYDNFAEWGQTVLVNFLNAGNIIPGARPYEMYLQYAFTGKVNFANPFLNVLFNGGSVDLFVDTDLTAGRQAGTSTSVGTFSVANGICDVRTTTRKGSCDINLRFSATPNYFSVGGTDVATFGPVNSYSNLVVTVQDIIGLLPVYPGGPNTAQNFTIRHDGNQTFTISEPTTVAVLGLGLLGLGVARRNKKQA